MSPLWWILVALALIALPLSSRQFRRLLFASAYDRVVKGHEAHISDRKRKLLHALHGKVLELGPGTGANFAYYPKDIEWIGLEPNPHMHAKLRAKAEASGIPCEFRTADATAIDLLDASVDAVVSTLVLCSVASAEQTLQEIRRVLKPGGRFVFLEHVADRPGTRTRWAQDRIVPIWRFLADGCHPNRELENAIRSAGFQSCELTAFRLPRELHAWIVAPHIAGYAIK